MRKLLLLSALATSGLVQAAEDIPDVVKHFSEQQQINIIKKHVKPNPQKGIKGGKLEKEGAIPLAKVMYFCQNCGQGVRVGFKLSEKGDKVRVCKKCGTTLD